eukprot:MONOS_4606.1-p1 / transcript=MONOS_4606.1 / gene=MONOS_4606 / organism=Monocercomonoides_exilis_PA203 / gene_product=unspecified product / transcript_product=unspecified product / location=Mono_scaffold00124:76842-77390(-) / protein_length=129 / sequence_SO=supercontig / SO=protein_coding / is_pseudo=false
MSKKKEKIHVTVPEKSKQSVVIVKEIKPKKIMKISGDTTNAEKFWQLQRNKGARGSIFATKAFQGSAPKAQLGAQERRSAAEIEKKEQQRKNAEMHQRESLAQTLKADLFATPSLHFDSLTFDENQML